MDFLHYQNGYLLADNVSICDLANQYGTPLYVYSADHITKQFLSYQDSLKNKKEIDLLCSKSE